MLTSRSTPPSLLAVQTARRSPVASQRRTQVLGISWFGLVVAAMAIPSRAAAQTATLVCAAEENDHAASATVRIESQGRVVKEAPCRGRVAVPPGTYQVTVRLDGALDRPVVVSSVELSPGETEQVDAEFRTGELLVDARDGSRRAAATVSILRNGVELGSHAAGVPCRLGAGTYEVVVRYRQRVIRAGSVAVRAGERETQTVRVDPPVTEGG